MFDTCLAVIVAGDHSIRMSVCADRTVGLERQTFTLDGE